MVSDWFVNRSNNSLVPIPCTPHIIGVRHKVEKSRVIIRFTLNIVKKSLILKKKIPALILASSSRYRAEILQRLQIPFAIANPKTDETALSGELPENTAQRLAELKAQSVAKLYTQSSIDTLVIGADQVADLNGIHIGKPITRDAAFLQLKSMRGEKLIFHTALVLIHAQSGRTHAKVVPTTVRLRDYSDAEISYYLDHENALDCAGSAKSEGLGAALIKQMTSNDPTALIGLPLLALIDMLNAEGVKILQ